MGAWSALGKSRAGRAYHGNDSVGHTVGKSVAFRLLFPSMNGLEWPVGFAHVVFGLLTSAIYRGLAKRRAPDAPPDSRD